ncbi:hypothetical protein GQ53DRAFT_811760 [Thozetella sp. PMI_491]|nr:hypothetical protein GQ53DRAFT_811760 [Thozetella sp. PMI_491]
MEATTGCGEVVQPMAEEKQYGRGCRGQDARTPERQNARTQGQRYSRKQQPIYDELDVRMQGKRTRDDGSAELPPALEGPPPDTTGWLENEIARPQMPGWLARRKSIAAGRLLVCPTAKVSPACGLIVGNRKRRPRRGRSQEPKARECRHAFPASPVVSGRRRRSHQPSQLPPFDGELTWADEQTRVSRTDNGLSRCSQWLGPPKFVAELLTIELGAPRS